MPGKRVMLVALTRVPGRPGAPAGGRLRRPPGPGHVVVRSQYLALDPQHRSFYLGRENAGG